MIQSLTDTRKHTYKVANRHTHAQTNTHTHKDIPKRTHTHNVIVMQLVYLFSTPTSIIYSSPAPTLLFRMASATNAAACLRYRTKGVNHMAYFAHVATVVWSALLFV